MISLNKLLYVGLGWCFVGLHCLGMTLDVIGWDDMERKSLTRFGQAKM